jgi:hypothetical protein
MPKKNKKREQASRYQSGLYTDELLRDKLYENGEKVFVILFPYNNSNIYQIFEAQINYRKPNLDFTDNYCVTLTCGFDKREILKDFFHNNWFNTAINRDFRTPNEFLEDMHKFSFVDHELVEEISNDKLKYGEYKTFFRNHAQKFRFFVNEAFIVEDYYEAMEYVAKLNLLSAAKIMKDLHDVTVSRQLRQSGSCHLYTKTTTEFIKKHKRVIIDIIKEMGSKYYHYAEEDNIYEFFEEFILDRKIKQVEFNKWRKQRLKQYAKHDLEREGLIKREKPLKGKD